MAEPVLDPTTERVYAQLPQHYKDRDALQNYQLKRYLAGLLSSQDAVNTVVDRLSYVPPDAGGPVDSTSDLVNPNTADLGWLKWLGQLFGTQVNGEILDSTRSQIINASGFHAGTQDSIIAAAQKVLTGSKKVRLVKHADDSWQPDMDGSPERISRTNMVPHPFWSASDTVATSTPSGTLGAVSNRWATYANSGATYTLGPGSVVNGTTLARITSKDLANVDQYNDCPNPQPVAITNWTDATTGWSPSSGSGLAAVAAPWDASRTMAQRTPTGSSTPYIFSATSPLAYTSGQRVYWRAKVWAKTAANYLIRLHIRTGNTYLTPESGQSSTFAVPAGGLGMIVSGSTVLPTAADVNQVDFSMVGTSGTQPATDVFGMGDVVISTSPVIEYWDGGTTRTNMLNDSSFETSTSNFGFTNYNTNSGRDTTRAHSGASSLKVLGSGATPDGVAAITGITVGKWYTFSAWIYRPSTNTTGTSKIYIGGTAIGSPVASVSTSVPANTWTKVSVTAQATQTGSITLYVYSSDTVDEPVWFDDVSLNEGSAPYDANVSYLWSGTANSSRSIRRTGNQSSGNTRLGIINQSGSIQPTRMNIPAGTTFWFSTDVNVSYTAHGTVAQDTAGTIQVQAIFRDDNVGDSGAATFDSATPAFQTITKGQNVKLWWKATVNPSRTITRIYITTSGSVAQPDGAYLETGNWLVTPVLSGETTLPDYFDGNTLAGPYYHYRWNGASELSTSDMFVPAIAPAINTAGPWDLLVMTLQSETLKNLLSPTLSKTLSPSVWDDHFDSFGYNPKDVWKLLVDQPDVFQNRALAYSLKDPTWQAGVTSTTGFGSGNFGEGTFGFGSDLVSTLRFTSHSTFPITQNDSFQFMVSLGLKQDTKDEKRSAIGAIFYDADGNELSEHSEDIAVESLIENNSVVSHNFIKSTKATNYSAYGTNANAVSISNFGNYEGGDIVRATINNLSTTSDFGIYLSPTFGLEPIPSGTLFTFSLDFQVDSSVNVDGIRVFFRDDTNGDNNAVSFLSSSPALVTVTKGRWHTRSWSATVNPGSTVTSAYVVVESSVNQSQGAFIDTANWLIEEGPVAGSYFNGDTPANDLYTYAWDGLPNASVTNKVLTSVAESNIVQMKQFSTRFMAPPSSTTAKVFIDMDGFNGRDTLYIAQPGAREEEDETWVPVTADPIQAVLDSGVKPAGIILHWKPIISNWDTITLAGTRQWQELEDLTWTETEELGE